MRVALSVLAVLLACVAAQGQPQYLAYRSPYQVPYYGDNIVDPEDPRLFRPTTTVTFTSTSTATCTQSTGTACARKRRGAILYQGEEEEQFPIIPTAVEGVEPTQVSSRDARAADPQVLLMSPPFAYQPQSGFQSGSYSYRPVVLPYYSSHVQPIAGQRLFFTQLQSALTVTTTSTVFTVTTFTSIPTCSKTGTIAQCPNA